MKQQLNEVELQYQYQRCCRRCCDYFYGSKYSKLCEGCRAKKHKQKVLKNLFSL